SACRIRTASSHLGQKLAMVTIEIVLPDALAEEATNAGPLSPERLESLPREHLRTERVGRLQAVRAHWSAQPLAPMTTEEIQAEIEAYRAGRATRCSLEYGLSGRALPKEPGVQIDRYCCVVASRRAANSASTSSLVRPRPARTERLAASIF
ncbi:MAG: hypothetical protein KIT73_03320, partial [Burkholderiales bacterium]|nr:hypothetical protein [Burkholderiales bacterium]